jgi:hypothetical protein
VNEFFKMSDEKNDLASWEKHTKGIGSKLLQKFGFSGRLGAKETGIEKPIEVNLRQVNVGLGFGNANASAINREKHQPKTKAKENARKRVQFDGLKPPKKKNRQNKKSLDMVLQDSFADPDNERKIQDKGHRYTGPISDSDEEGSDSFGELDRNNDDDEVAGMNEVTDQSDSSFIQRYYQNHSIKFQLASPEFQKPLKLVEIGRKLVEQRNLERITNNKIELTEERKTHNLRKFYNLEKIFLILNGVNEIIQETDRLLLDKQRSSSQHLDENTFFAELLENFDKLKAQIALLFAKYPEEYSVFGIHTILFTVFKSIIFGCYSLEPLTPSSSMKSWRLNFMLPNTLQKLIVVFSEIFTFLEEVFPFERRKEIENSILTPIFERFVLQELFTFIKEEYNPILHTTVLMDYLKLFKSYLFENPVLIQMFLVNFQTSAIQKLKSCISSWTYSFTSEEYSVSLSATSEVQSANLSLRSSGAEKLKGKGNEFLFHNWILPFLVVFTEIQQKDVITQLFPDVRHKINCLLKQWDPLEPKISGKLDAQDEKEIEEIKELKRSNEINFIISLVAPWKGQFDSRSYLEMILKNILPKLHSFCANAFIINPGNQKLGPFEEVFRFYHQLVIPIDYFQSLIITEFFPKFFQVLLSWLQSYQTTHNSRVFPEIACWYEGWKQFFSADFFNSNKASSSFLSPSSAINNFQVAILFDMAMEMIQDYITAYLITANELNFAVKERKISVLNQKYSRLGRILMSLNYTKLIGWYHLKTQSTGGVSKFQSYGGGLHTSKVTLKEMIENLAQKLNVEFTFSDLNFGTKKSFIPAGKHIYQFSKELIYVENNVIFKYEKGSDVWKPVSFDELRNIGE